MKKNFLILLFTLLAMKLIAFEAEDYSNEDYMIDPRISAGEEKKAKNQVGESSYEHITADQVIAGDRFDEGKVPSLIEEKAPVENSGISQ